GEYVPVPGTRRDGNTLHWRPNLFYEGQCFRDRARRCENPRMGDDAQDAAKDKVRNPVRFIAADQRFEPLPIGLMVLRSFPVGINKDVYVGKNHERLSISSSRAAESFRSTPGWTRPRTVVSRMRFLGR